MSDAVGKLVEGVLSIEGAWSILDDRALFHLRAIGGCKVYLVRGTFGKLHLFNRFLHLLMSLLNIKLALNLTGWIRFIWRGLKLRQKCIELVVICLLRLLEFGRLVAHMVELVDLYVLYCLSFIALSFIHTAKLASALLLIQIFLVFVVILRVDPILKSALIDHHLIFVRVLSLLSAIGEGRL